MALRLSREQAAIELPEPEEETVVSFRPYARPSAQDEQTQRNCEEPDVVTETGDDDEADLEDLAGEDDFYADALEDV